MIYHIAQAVRNLISFFEMVGFHSAKFVNKVLIYGLFLSSFDSSKREAETLVRETNLKKELLDKREEELNKQIEEVEKLKKELEEIKGFGRDGAQVVKKLRTRIQKLEGTIDNQRKEVAQARKLKRKDKFRDLKLRRLEQVKKRLDQVSGKGKEESPVMQALKAETEELKSQIELLKEGGKLRIPLASKLKQLREPKLKLRLNPVKCIANILAYRKQKAEFDKAAKEISKALIHFKVAKEKKLGGGIKIKNDRAKAYRPESITEADRHVEVGDKYIRTYYLADLPSFLSPYVLFKLVNSSIPFRVSLFTKPSPSSALIKKARERQSVLETQQNDRLKKGKVRDQEIDKNMDEIQQFIDELVHEVEKGFIFSMYVGIEADTKAKLLKLHKQFQNLVDSMEFTFNTYTYGQRKAFDSLLPLNEDSVGENRILQTSAVSYLTPFLSKLLNDKAGVFLGFNAYNGTLVFIDFFKARNSNINIFGTSGSGKSVTAKLIATRLFLRGIQTLIIDPEHEYVELAKEIKGEVIQFTRDNGINPFYIGSASEDDILNHISTLKTFFKFFIPEKSFDSAILDKKLVEVYERGEPNFQNLLKSLKKDKAGRAMHEYLSVLEKGSLKGVFNSRQEMKLDNDFIVFDISELDEEEKQAPAMYLLTSLIWNIVNRKDNRRRMLFVDEAHNLLTDRDVAIFYKDIVKRARKRRLGVVSITQNVEDFVDNEFGKGILTNAETTILLKQSYATLKFLGDIYPITDEERDALGSLAIGESVLFREKEHVRLNVYPLPSEFELVRTD